MMRSTQVAAGLLCLFASCSVFDRHRAIPLAQAEEVVSTARTEIAAGEYGAALDRLLRAYHTEGLSPDLRAVADGELQAAFEGIFTQIRSDDEALLDLFELKMPTRLRATAGVRAAEVMLETDRPLTAYRTIARVDSELPLHPLRAQASEVVAQAGFSLIHNDGRYRLILKYRTQGIAALEYLVLNYPSSSHCPRAYVELARSYEDDRDLDEAIARCEDLLVYHPRSIYAVASEARLPYLRMLRLEHDSYDRRELLDARLEIDRWLSLHAGHELESWMRELRVQCFTRLARSDLYVAKHYLRYRSAFGARIHAERALAEATVAEDEGLQRDAREVLDEVAAELGPEVAGAGSTVEAASSGGTP